MLKSHGGRYMLVRTCSAVLVVYTPQISREEERTNHDRTDRRRPKVSKVWEYSSVTDKCFMCHYFSLKNKNRMQSEYNSNAQA